MLVYTVEDSLDIIEVEKYALEKNGFKVESFETGESILRRIEEKKPDLILLDIIIGEENGFDILEKIRSNSQTENLPVILLSSCDSELDKTRGLDAGADDYIAKPFGVMEFISRVKAVLRRAGVNHNEEKIVIGNISIDRMKREVLVRQEICNLTYKEYELLLFLVLNKGIVLSREKIMERVWGFDFQGESRTVDMHIKTLRHKLGEEGNLIKTIRNVGYKMI